MRASHILVIAFAAKASALDTQHILGSLNLPTSSYECKNGVRPSIVCDDPSAEKPNCSCTCTNGITFNQPLDPFRSAGGAISDTVCQAEKTGCLAREQTTAAELTTLKAQLTAYKNAPAYMYLGCFIDESGLILKEKKVNETTMTVQRCETICTGHKYYALQHHQWCHCGSLFENPTQHKPEADCTAKCTGDSSQNCGGAWRKAVYVKKPAL